jgi:hypothetical protein
MIFNLYLLCSDEILLHNLFNVYNELTAVTLSHPTESGKLNFWKQFDSYRGTKSLTCNKNQKRYKIGKSVMKS